MMMMMMMMMIRSALYQTNNLGWIFVVLPRITVPIDSLWLILESIWISYLIIWQVCSMFMVLILDILNVVLKDYVIQKCVLRLVYLSKCVRTLFTIKRQVRSSLYANMQLHAHRRAENKNKEQKK